MRVHSLPPSFSSAASAGHQPPSQPEPLQRELPVERHLADAAAGLALEAADHSAAFPDGALDHLETVAAARFARAVAEPRQHLARHVLRLDLGQHHAVGVPGLADG